MKTEIAIKLKDIFRNNSLALGMEALELLFAVMKAVSFTTDLTTTKERIQHRSCFPDFSPCTCRSL